MIFRSIYNKPILLVGNGVRSSGAAFLVHEFEDKTHIPVLTTMNGVDLCQDEYHIGFIGTHGNRVANMILNECDLVISVGARLGIRQVGKNASGFAPKADLIRVDIDEYELSRNIKQNEYKIHMDAKVFFELLLKRPIGDYSKWRDKCLEAKGYLSNYDIQPGNLAIMQISTLLPENPIIAVDVGMNQCWAAQSLHLKGKNGRIHIAGGFGAMGCGLPFAIGSSIATNNGIVFCICGDGGLQMNIQELETIKREKLPIKIFVLNNHVLGKISETQHFNYADRFVATTEKGGYSVPDFCKIAEAYGIKSILISDINQLKCNKKWLEDDEPSLFNIILPEKSFLTPKIKFETGMIYPKLDEFIIKKVEGILS